MPPSASDHSTAFVTEPHADQVPALAVLAQRASTNHFDQAHALQRGEVEALVQWATTAPTAYHLQNWRFIAVQSAAAKQRLLPLAFGQAKATQAAVTFIVCGQLPEPETLATRLQPFVQAGFMPANMVNAWIDGAATQYAHPPAARDEAVRSASLGAASLMVAAGAMGLASAPMGGFDPAGVAREFNLGPHELPVMLVAVGRATGDPTANWPQKPRRPLAEVLDFA